MLKLLDDGDFTAQNNANQDKAYIDPAIDIDNSGKPDYSGNPICLAKDPQKISVSRKDETSDTGEAQTLTSQLAKIGDIVEGLIKSSALDGKQKESLLLTAVLGEVRRASDEHSKFLLSNEFPRISRLSRIDQLLRQSASKADMISAQLTEMLNLQLLNDLDVTEMDVHVDTHLAKENAFDAQKLLDQLKNLDTLKVSYRPAINNNPSKDAKDCRAPLMLVVP